MVDGCYSHLVRKPLVIAGQTLEITEVGIQMVSTECFIKVGCTMVLWGYPIWRFPKIVVPLNHPFK